MSTIVLAVLFLAFDFSVTVALCRQYRREGFTAGFNDCRRLWKNAVDAGTYVPAGTQLPESRAKIPMPPVKAPKARTMDHGAVCECNACVWENAPGGQTKDRCGCETCRDERAGSGNC